MSQSKYKYVIYTVYMCVWEHEGFTKPYFPVLHVWLSDIFYHILLPSMLLADHKLDFATY